MMANNHEQIPADLPPSVKLVYYVIRHDGPMTQKALAEESMLPPRTVRYGINRLEEIDIITQEVYLKDPRQTIYEISMGDSDNGASSTVTAADD